MIRPFNLNWMFLTVHRTSDSFCLKDQSFRRYFVGCLTCSGNGGSSDQPRSQVKYSPLLSHRIRFLTSRYLKVQYSEKLNIIGLFCQCYISHILDLKLIKHKHEINTYYRWRTTTRPQLEVKASPCWGLLRTVSQPRRQPISRWTSSYLLTSMCSSQRDYFWCDFTLMFSINII